MVAAHRVRHGGVVQGIESQLLRRSKPSNFLYVAERVGGGFIGKMDHLVCFLPGVLALSSLRPATPDVDTKHHLELAKEVMKTCNQFYHLTSVGASLLCLSGVCR